MGKKGELIPLESFAPSFDRGVKVDFDSWHPKLKANGVVIIHDFNHPEHLGVDKVWKEEVPHKLASIL